MTTASEAIAATPLRAVHQAVTRLDHATRGMPGSRSRVQWLRVVSETQRAINTLTAVQDSAIAALAALDEHLDVAGDLVESDRGLGHVALDTPDLVSEALVCSTQQASRRIELAIRLVGREPVCDEDRRRDPRAGSGPSGLHVLSAAMRAGHLDGYRARVVADELVLTDPATAATIVDRLADRLTSDPPSQLRRRTRRLLAAVDADSVRRRAEQARSDCSLRRWVQTPGVDTWLATLPAEHAAPAWAAVEERARVLIRQGLAPTLDRARAQALTDLITGQATVTVSLTVAVPDSPFATDTGAPDSGGFVEARIPGRPGPHLVPTSWFDERQVTRIVTTHPQSGAAVSTATTSPSTGYRPSPSLVDLIRLRDGHCRFPGCTIAAHHCDVDHARPWPDGPTTAANLLLLCRRHHRVKQQPGWSLRLHADATITWTTPTASQRTTYPVDHHDVIHLPGPTPTPTPTADQASPRPTRAARSRIRPPAPISPLEYRVEHLLAGAPRPRHRPPRRDRGPTIPARHPIRVETVPYLGPPIELDWLGRSGDPGPPPF